MPKAMCQLNVTLDVPTAEWVERIANDIHVRPSGCGRMLVEQRLSLEEAGWKCEDLEMGKILEAIVSLDERGRGEVRRLLVDLGVLSKHEEDEPQVDLLPDSYFRTGVLRPNRT